jgi:hypothetical protein
MKALTLISLPLSKRFWTMVFGQIAAMIEWRHQEKRYKKERARRLRRELIP